MPNISLFTVVVPLFCRTGHGCPKACFSPFGRTSGDPAQTAVKAQRINGAISDTSDLFDFYGPERK